VVTLFIGVGFSHDQGLDVFVLFVFFLLLVIIIVVGISRRHLVARDSEENPVSRPSRNTFKGTQDHVGSYWMSQHSQSKCYRARARSARHGVRVGLTQIPRR